MLFEACGDGPEMLELVEEAFDQVAVAVEPGAEGRDVYPVRHGFDVGPGAALGHFHSQGVTVIASVGEQDLVCAEAVQQISSTATIMRLAFSQLERDGVAVGVHHGVDLGGQSAARAPHASGRSDVPSDGFRRTPFLTLAAC